MVRTESPESGVPVVERERLYFPDAITNLIAERGHENRQKWLDGWLDRWPRDYPYAAATFPAIERRGQRHDTILYSMYRLDEIALERDWPDIRDRLESYALAMTIRNAEEDGDHKVAKLTRQFAEWAGLEIRDSRATR